MAVGFEKMNAGEIPDERSRTGRCRCASRSRPCGRGGPAAVPIAAQMFANAAKDTPRPTARLRKPGPRCRSKGYSHAVNNPSLAVPDRAHPRRDPRIPDVSDPLTRTTCCPTSDGGAAAILPSERFVEEHGPWGKAVEIAGMHMATDTRPPSTAPTKAMVGSHMNSKSRGRSTRSPGSAPRTSRSSSCTTASAPARDHLRGARALCPEGKGGDLLLSGATTYGGQWVVNPSGGLLSKGHPLGATGLAQCAELTWQLRGEADKRQVDGATAALQHNLGLGGAGVAAVYKKVS